MTHIKTKTLSFLFIIYISLPLLSADATIFDTIFGKSVSCGDADEVMRKGIQEFYNYPRAGMEKIKIASKACHNNSEFKYNLGVAYYKTGDIKDAMSEFKDTLRIQNGFTEARIALAWTYIMGRIDIDKGMDLALSTLKRAKDSRLYFILAYGSKQKGDDLNWKKWINKARLASYEENKDNIRQYKHALNKMEGSINMKSRIPILNAELGFLYEKTGDYKSAVFYYKKSNSPYGWRNMGRMYARQDKIDKARDMLKHALEFSSTLDSNEIKQIKADLRQLNNKIYLYRKAINFIYPEKFTLIPAGEFTMGSNDGPKIEQPEHIVYIDPFLMGNFEVTNTEYKIYVDSSGYIPPYNCCKAKYDMWNANYISASVVNYPVVNVSWYDAVRYINWKNKKFKKKYRLPTEAEWEKAARGTDKRVYPWGNDTPTLELAYFSRHWDGENTFVEVDSYDKGKSPYGIHHMAGGVWEWCNDWFKKGYFVRGKRKNPIGPTLGDFKVMRGGSWMNLRRFIRSSYRNRNWPDVRYNGIGFRLASDL